MGNKSRKLCISGICFIAVYVLSVLLVWQWVLLVKEKFENKSRLVTATITTIILLIVLLKPNSIINFKNFSGKILLLAEREGAANCNTVFKLKEANEFTELTYCFGATETKGKYELKNDTIFFKEVKVGRGGDKYFEYAVIRPLKFPDKKIIADLIRYKDNSDTVGNVLRIITNELNKPAIK